MEHKIFAYLPPGCEGGVTIVESAFAGAIVSAGASGVIGNNFLLRRKNSERWEKSFLNMTPTP